MKRKELIRHLNTYNCVLLKHGSKHDKYINLDNGIKTMIPRHTEIKTFVGKMICKQLEIPVIKSK